MDYRNRARHAGPDVEPAFQRRAHWRLTHGPVVQAQSRQSRMSHRIQTVHLVDLALIPAGDMGGGCQRWEGIAAQLGAKHEPLSIARQLEHNSQRGLSAACDGKKVRKHSFGREPGDRAQELFWSALGPQLTTRAPSDREAESLGQFAQCGHLVITAAAWWSNWLRGSGIQTPITRTAPSSTSAGSSVMALSSA